MGRALKRLSLMYAEGILAKEERSTFKTFILDENEQVLSTLLSGGGEDPQQLIIIYNQLRKFVADKR